MNVIDLLKSDHDKVEGLLDSYESAKRSDSGEKQKLVEQICQELDVHAEVEEELFYPAVDRSAQEDGKDEKHRKRGTR
jgi:hemerythrin superfamily protein